MSDKPCNREPKARPVSLKSRRPSHRTSPPPTQARSIATSTPQSVLAPLRGETHNCWASTLELKLSGDSDIKTKQPHGTAARPGKCYNAHLCQGPQGPRGRAGPSSAREERERPPRDWGARHSRKRGQCDHRLGGADAGVQGCGVMCPQHGVPKAWGC